MVNGVLIDRKPAPPPRQSTEPARGAREGNDAFGPSAHAWRKNRLAIAVLLSRANPAIFSRGRESKGGVNMMLPPYGPCSVRFEWRYAMERRRGRMAGTVPIPFGGTGGDHRRSGPNSGANTELF